MNVRLGQRRLERHVLLWVVTLISLIPLVFMLATSVKSSDEYLHNPAGLPKSPTLANYSNAIWHLPTVRWAGNSLAVTAIAVLVSTTIGALAAYAIAFGWFRGRGVLLNSSIAFIMVPPVVLVLPMFVVMVNWGLVNNLLSVIIFYSCLMVPFSVFFLVNFFSSVPSELLEAATADGAGPLRALWSIVLPISHPALVTVCVVNAVWAWNELLISLIFLQSENRRTLMAGLTLFQGRYATDQPLVLAVATLSILPVAVFYLIAQRSFVRGLTAGISK